MIVVGADNPRDLYDTSLSMGVAEQFRAAGYPVEQRFYTPTPPAPEPNKPGPRDGRPQALR